MKTTKLRKARENAGDQVVIGFSFAADWLKERCKLFGSITKRHWIENCSTEFVYLINNEILIIKYQPKELFSLSAFQTCKFYRGTVAH